MSSFEISLIALVCLVGGFLLGVWLQFLLPEHHLSDDSKDTVKLGSGMVATMSALILGLLVSSAKNSFDAVNLSIAQNGAKIVQLDHLLAEYGPETHAIRDQLKESVFEYTTVGSNFNLPLHWRLLEGMIATAGLLTFAWSTGILMTLAQEFQDQRMQWFQRRHEPKK